MYSVTETARKITCPTESDEMNLKRIVRSLKRVPNAKSLIEIATPPKFVNVYTAVFGFSNCARTISVSSVDSTNGPLQKLEVFVVTVMTLPESWLACHKWMKRSISAAIEFHSYECKKTPKL